VVIASRLEQLLVLQGDLAKKRWVQHIHFSGLSFAHTNWTLPPAGQDFPQAEIGLNAAIVAIGARQIVLERCAVRHVGGYGFRKSTSRSRPMASTSNIGPPDRGGEVLGCGHGR
jgi:hypothetical protein